MYIYISSVLFKELFTEKKKSIYFKCQKLTSDSKEKKNCSSIRVAKTPATSTGMEKLGPDLQKNPNHLNSGRGQIIPVWALITGDKCIFKSKVEWFVPTYKYLL